MVNVNNKKTGSLLYFFIGVVTIIILNQLSSRYFFRIDLTEEKRYSISETTKDLLRNLDEVVYVDVYLEGEFPPSFKRLQKSIRETLNEYKIYADDRLQYRFIDPSAATSEKVKNEFYQSLAGKGIQPTNVYDNKNGKATTNLIFPGAVLTYGTNETGINLLKGNKASSPEEQINQSIEGIEFELSAAIKKLSETRTKRIAILHGHGELDTLQTAGLTSELLQHFRVYHVNLTSREDLIGYDALIMAKPTEAFSEKDKYKIDQFIMRGGKAVFLLDALAVDMDSASAQGTIALPFDTNLDNLFFKYGFRVNKNFVLDLKASPYPVVVGNMGENPQVMLLTWPFFPLVNHFSDHVISRNLDAVYTRFVSSIDTLKATGIRKTPLFSTSQYSRIMSAPVKVSINDLREEMKPEYFTSGPQTIAWLYEGRFSSLYKNRFLPEGVDKADFLADGNDSKIIIVSDGDIAQNDVNPQTQKPVELGFDQFTNKKYANAEFLVNAMIYMLEEDGLIKTRSKEIMIRPLDKVKIKDQKVFWQLVNILIPVILILIFGVLKYGYRKRKYTRF